jgi:hypothetical protein
MILDSTLILAQDQDATVAPTLEVDLGSSAAGPGEPVTIFVSGSEDIAGVDGFSVMNSPDMGTYTEAMTVPCDLAGNTVQATLPSDVQRYIKIELTGTPTAGKFSAGLVLDVQTSA